MAAKITTRLPQPEGVVAGGTATFRIPTGRRIHKLILAYAYNASTQNVADFTEIRIYINGQVFQRFNGTERDTLNKFDRLEASTGVLVIPFDRENLNILASIEETALNTGVADPQTGKRITSMYMEIDLDSGMTIAASDLTLYSVESDPLPGGPGTVPYIRREQRSPAGADSDYQISDLVNPGINAPDKIALNRVTFIPSTGTLASLRIDRNNFIVFDRTDAINRAVQNGLKKTAQSGYYTIDTTEQGEGGAVINLFDITDYRYRVNASTAMTLTILSEYMGVLTA